LQQEGKAVDIISAPALTDAAAFVKKNQEIKITQIFIILAHN
jgi:hypothetical protein